MKVLVTGSHGLVGSALVPFLASHHHTVCRLVRSAPAAGSTDLPWNPDKGELSAESLEGFDAVIHLAGESIAGERWTPEKKSLIRSSRIASTQLLTKTLVDLKQPPQVFICASAIGYYGNCGEALLTEKSPSGHDFLAELCAAWEAATERASLAGIRVVNARFGLILSERGGALQKMLPPFRMGAGGALGSGQQYMSWVTLDDVVSILKFILDTPGLSGPVNVVTPNPARNLKFAKVLGDVLNRPAITPIPAFVTKLLFGEMAEALLLSSQRVYPAKLLDAGYPFQYPELFDALMRLLRENPATVRSVAE